MSLHKFFNFRQVHKVPTEKKEKNPRKHFKNNVDSVEGTSERAINLMENAGNVYEIMAEIFFSFLLEKKGKQVKIVVEMHHKRVEGISKNVSS
jgi:hypothetical protein